MFIKLTLTITIIFGISIMFKLILDILDLCSKLLELYIRKKSWNVLETNKKKLLF